MKISEDVKLDFDDVLIKPKRSSLPSRDFPLTRKFNVRSGGSIEGFPLIVANMDTTGTFAMGKSLAAQKGFVALNKHYTVEDLKANWNGSNCFVTFGMSDKDIEKITLLKEVISKEWIDPKICLDVANGYTEKFVEHVAWVRSLFPKAIIMAGNVCTSEMTEQLILSGADIVKVGIGSGSVCTTRLTAGVGYPQLSALLECKDAAHGLRGLVCSDGGCRRGCDVSKAFGAGADFVMVGGMFAGTEECDGEWEYEEVKNQPKYKVVLLNKRTIFEKELQADPSLKQYVVESWHDARKGCGLYKIEVPVYEEIKPAKLALKFYGMSSKEAHDKHSGGLKKYKAAEGKCVRIPYKGPAEQVLLDIMGSVRSGCSYVGATCLKDYDKCCSFVRVNRTHNTVYGDSCS